jgi:hypothetical protein
MTVVCDTSLKESDPELSRHVQSLSANRNSLVHEGITSLRSPLLLSAPEIGHRVFNWLESHSHQQTAAAARKSPAAQHDLRPTTSSMRTRMRGEHSSDPYNEDHSPAALHPPEKAHAGGSPYGQLNLLRTEAMCLVTPAPRNARVSRLRSKCFPCREGHRPGPTTRHQPIPEWRHEAPDQHPCRSGCAAPYELPAPIVSG